MKALPLRTALVLLSCAVPTLAVVAVLQSERPASAQNDPGRRVELNGTVKPAFRISPLVHRFEARRGQSIPFEFEVESLGKQTALEIRPVSLTQRENGAVVPDTESPPPEQIRLQSAASMLLRAGQKDRIRGRVVVPLVDSPFHTYGLLVTDLGRIVDNREIDTPNADGKSRIGVRFITRYLLRLDIVVSGASGLNARQLQLHGGELVETDGRPQARLWVHNPTDQPFEFEVRCRLDSALGKRGKEFSLVLPVRANVDPPDRFRARVLPKTRVRLEEFLPEPVFPGRYTLRTELHAAGRKQLSHDFEIAVGDDDFPAQNTAVVQIADAVSVTPTQIELSLRRRGSRLVPLSVSNHSAQPISIRLSAQPFDVSADLQGHIDAGATAVKSPKQAAGARDVDWLIVRPEEFSLEPDRARKVLVAVRTGGEVDGHQYGMLRVHATPQTGQADDAYEIPVALISRDEDVHDIKVGPLQWQFDRRAPAFVLPVANAGTIHVPLNASLAIADAFGRPVQLRAGYDRWLLPGCRDELVFRTQPLKPGPYRLQARVERPGQEPLVIEQAVEIPPTSPSQPGPTPSAGRHSDATRN